MLLVTPSAAIVPAREDENPPRLVPDIRVRFHGGLSE